MRHKKAIAFFLSLSLVLINCPHGSCKKAIQGPIARDGDDGTLSADNYDARDFDDNKPEKLANNEATDLENDNKPEKLVNNEATDLENDNKPEKLVDNDGTDLENDTPDDNEPLQNDENGSPVEAVEDDINSVGNTACWVTTNVNELYKVLDDLDEKYAEARTVFHKNIMADNMDTKMLNKMMESKGAGFEAIVQAGGFLNNIPSGLNIGGYSMLKLENSILFIYRMKLRNDTFFRVDFLKNDVYNMVLTARVNLNDLHLIGAYERSIIDRDPTKMFYQPTYGETELFLKNVNYKMEGRYRLVQGQLWVEHVVSDLRVQDMLMKYAGNVSDCDNPPEQLPLAARDDFVNRLKICLDVWMKDYFNDYLRENDITQFVPPNIDKYEKEKTIALNDFVDNVVTLLKKRLYTIEPPCANVAVAGFTIFAIHGIQIKLYDGVLRGLDSMYRQSIATTGKTGDNLRIIDAIIAFSNLKFEYKYKAVFPAYSAMMPLAGLIVLSADELTTSMKISMVRDSRTVDVVFNYVNQTRGLDLIIEGLLNRRIANFKHLLENQIITLMLNNMINEIKSLGSITSCVPSCVGHLDPGQEMSKEKEKYVISDGAMDYKIEREDSIEFEVPAGDNQAVKKMHLKYREQINLTEKEKAKRRMRRRKSNSKNKKNKNKISKQKKKKTSH